MISNITSSQRRCFYPKYESNLSSITAPVSMLAN